MKIYTVGWEEDSRPLYFLKFESALVWFSTFTGQMGVRAREMTINPDGETRYCFERRGGKIVLSIRHTDD